jgi:hypothetical protein
LLDLDVQSLEERGEALRTGGFAAMNAFDLARRFDERRKIFAKRLVELGQNEGDQISERFGLPSLCRRRLVRGCDLGNDRRSVEPELVAGIGQLSAATAAEVETVAQEHARSRGVRGGELSQGLVGSNGGRHSLLKSKERTAGQLERICRHIG